MIVKADKYGSSYVIPCADMLVLCKKGRRRKFLNNG